MAKTGRLEPDVPLSEKITRHLAAFVKAAEIRPDPVERPIGAGQSEVSKREEEARALFLRHAPGTAVNGSRN